MHDPHDSSHPTWQRLVKAAKATPSAEPSDALPADFADKLFSRLSVQNASPLERLVEAAKTAPAAEPAEAPYGFATRIVARWQQVRQLRGYVLWRRWSLAATACSFAVFLGVSGFSNLRTAQEPILPVPGIELPTTTASLASQP